MAVNILLMQGALVTIFCLLFLVVSSVNGFYWFFTALSTELYMCMYVLMFCAALKLHYTNRQRDSSFKIPGGAWGMWTISLCGLIGCGATIVVSFFPPGNIDVGSPVQYFYMIAAGNILALSPLLLFYWYQKKEAGLVVHA